MKLFLSLAVVCFLAIWRAEARCECAADRYEGKIGMVYGAAGLLAQGSGTFAADWTLGKIMSNWTIENVGSGASRSAYYYDVAKGTVHTVDWSKNTCTAMTMPADVRLSKCLIREAIHTGDMTVGAGASTAQVENYMLDNVALGRVYLQLSKECTPSGIIVAGSRGTGFLANLGFYNVEMTVRDSTSFSLPSFCSNAAQVPPTRPPTMLERLNRLVSRLNA